MTTAEVEKIRLRANFLNSVASSSFVAAIVTPAIGLSIGTIGTTLNWLTVGSAAIFWVVLAVILHLIAVRVLGRLE